MTLKDLTNQNEFLWTSDYFINRKFMMQEMYENFANGEDINVPQVKVTSIGQNHYWAGIRKAV